MRVDHSHKTKEFKCGHAFEPENQVKLGGFRVGCKTCRNARAEARRGGEYLAKGPVLDHERIDPDSLLRRF